MFRSVPFYAGQLVAVCPEAQKARTTRPTLIGNVEDVSPVGVNVGAACWAFFAMRACPLEGGVTEINANVERLY
jgi:hypothetical protein